MSSSVAEEEKRSGGQPGTPGSSLRSSWLVCPLEWRYGSDEMRRVFSRDSMVRRYLEVEKAIVRGLAAAGIAPPRCVEVAEKCSEAISAEEVYELEKSLGHDIASLTYLLGERCGECSSYIHLGATSYDVIDTAWALAIRDALALLKSRLRKLVELICEKARRYKGLLMVGRTHGQHALPITLGFKFANYAYELARSYERLCDVERRVVKGKISGAVGTMAAWGEKGITVERVALEQLGLEPHAITTQVAPRDGFAELVCVLAILASQLDRLALEVRELSRPEIDEVREPGAEVGSSTMPHKRNPVLSERVSGLARIARSLAVAALENVVLMHERDLTNSSCERILIPHVFLVLDQMLIDSTRVVEGLEVNPEAMKKNLELTRGAIMSESVMVRLALKGVPRHHAHRHLIRLARRAEREGREFQEVLLEDPLVRSVLSEQELEEALDYSSYLGCCEELIKRALEYARSAVKRC